MSAVSVREFSRDPSGMFSRVERGETIEVTRHGRIIAVLLPGSGGLSRYAPLVSEGLVRLSSTTTSDVRDFPRCAVPPDVSPLDLLLDERAEDDR